MISPLQQQQQHHQSQQQQRHSQPFFAPPPPCSSSPSIVAERARAAAHDALARCSYAGAAFFAEQLASLPGATPADAALLAHAHLLSGNPRRALAALERQQQSRQQQPPASASPDPRTRLLAARCLAALGRWDDVLDCLGDGGESEDGEENDEIDDADDEDDDDTGSGFLDLRPDENGVVPFDRAARAAGATTAGAGSCSPSHSSSSSLLADAWLLRARARSAAGDARGAAAAFERALRRDPRCVEAFDALVVGGLAPPARHAALVGRAARRLAARGDAWLADLYAARCACAPGCCGGGGGGVGGGGGGDESSLERAEAALARLQAPAPPTPLPADAAAASDDNMSHDATTAAFHSPEGVSSQQPRRVTRAMARSGGGGGSASGGAGSVSGGGGGGGSTLFSTPGRGGSGPGAASEAPATVSSRSRRAAGTGGGGGGGATEPSSFCGHGLAASADVAAAAASLALARGDPRLAFSLSFSAGPLARGGDPGAAHPLALRARVAACAELSGSGSGPGGRAELFRLAHALVAAAPRDPEAWHAVGAYYLASRNPRAARRAFARALACCDGGHAAAWVGLGHACSLAGEGDAAVAAYRAAGTLAPGSPAPLLGQGVEAARMGAPALAASLLRAAHEAAPADPAPCHELAALALSSRGVGGCDGVGGEGKDGGGEDGDDGDGDDEVFKRGGDPAAAEAWARRALSLASASPSSSPSSAASLEPTLVLLGHALLRQRRPEEACEAFERAIACNNGNGNGGGSGRSSSSLPASSTFVALGVARHASGDPSGAAEAYHSALAASPGDSLAAELLDAALRSEAEEACEWLDGV